IISANFSTVLYHSWSCGATPATLWRTAGIASTPKTGWAPPLQAYLDTQSAAANKDSCYTAATPTMTFGGNLAGDLQNAVNGSWATYTVALSAADWAGGGEGTGSRWKKFIVGSQKLSVNFNHAPAPPAQADMSIDPASPCGP